jgi:hypothetical protein
MQHETWFLFSKLLEASCYKEGDFEPGVDLGAHFYFFCFCFEVLGLELMSFTLSHSTYFYEGFFKIRSCELFAQAGFKP